MVTGKLVLWSCAAIAPVLGVGAWYGTHSDCCWPGCCGANATAQVESQTVAAECCSDGPCCPDCCYPDCCEVEAKVLAAEPTVKEKSDSDCCSTGNCCTAPAAKKTALVQAAEKVCPLCPLCP
jgi:hypothetical protein